MKFVKLAVIVIVSGCSSTQWYRAGCIRYKYDSYNIVACDDTAVGEHCRRICPLDDKGNPVNFYPRACKDVMGFSLKPIIFVGKSYMGCLPHEIAHVEHPYDPEWVEKHYPCVEDH